VLVAAMMHAGWNLVAKRGRDGLVAMALIKLPNIALSCLVLLVVGLPGSESWGYLVASGAMNCLYFYFLINAYRAGDLSLAYPVARGLAPLLVLALSAALAAEVPGAGALAGVVVTCAGIFALAGRSRASSRDLATVSWAAGVAFCIAVYTLLDGLGARHSGNPVGYVAVLNIITGIVVCGTAVWRRGPALGEAVRSDWKGGVLGGALMLSSYTIVVYAMTLAPLAQVAALRESSVVFAAILGALFLKEPFGAKRIAASFAVACGIAILALAR
jgi:drug/metabolite transporter (DMT)-like permease